MQCNDVSPAKQERMRLAVQPVIDKFMASYDPEIQKLYKSEIERVLKIK